MTLASALKVRGEALSEEEIWSLLSLAAERLLEDVREGKRVCLCLGPLSLERVECEASQTNTFLGAASPSVISLRYYNE